MTDKTTNDPLNGIRTILGWRFKSVNGKAERSFYLVRTNGQNWNLVAEDDTTGKKEIKEQNVSVDRGLEVLFGSATHNPNHCIPLQKGCDETVLTTFEAMARLAAGSAREPAPAALPQLTL